jgi:hypothetical protein
MCLILSVLLFGPRIVLVFWWLADSVRWTATFDTILVPILGFLFLPWTTIMYVLVFPQGIVGLDWLVLGLALLADVGSLAGGAWRGRGQMQGYQSPPPGPPVTPP